MSDEQAKGAVNKARGKLEVGLGKLTGDKQEQATGEARQIKGSAQQGLGHIKDALRRP